MAMCRWYRGLSSRGGDRAFEQGHLLLGLDRSPADRLHEHFRGVSRRQVARELERDVELADDVTESLERDPHLGRRIGRQPGSVHAKRLDAELAAHAIGRVRAAVGVTIRATVRAAVGVTIRATVRMTVRPGCAGAWTV